MDEDKSVIAQQFDTKIEESAQKHKSETLRLIEEARGSATKDAEIAENTKFKQPKPKNHHHKKKHDQPEDFWFMHNQPQNADPNVATFQANPVIHPGNDVAARAQVTPTAQTDDKPLDEDEVLAKVHEKQRRDAMRNHSSHLKTVSPLGEKPKSAQSQDNQAQAMTTEKDPDILKLASNNDLNIETLSRTARRDRDLPEDEVVISLHQ
jgi:hypothetical protein